MERAVLLTIIILFVQISAGLKPLSVDGIENDKLYAKMPVMFENDVYDRCFMKYGHEARYCLAEFEVFPEDARNSSEIWNIIQKFNRVRTNYRHDILMHGFCISANETVSERLIANYKDSGLGAKITDLNCQNYVSKYEKDFFDSFFANALIFYIGFVVIATVWNELCKSKVFQSFSLLQSWESLAKDCEEKTLKSIQGVRVAFALIIIMCHSLGWMIFNAVLNPEFLEKMTASFPLKLVHSAEYPLQLCFMLSSWMLTHNTLKKQQKLTVLDVIKIIYNRYTRIIPGLSIVLGIASTSYYVNFLRGAYTEDIMAVAAQYKNCRKSWWKLLFFSNENQFHNMCLQETWYLWTDSIFYLLTVGILFFTMKKNALFIILAGFLSFYVLKRFQMFYFNSVSYIVTYAGRDLFHINLFRQSNSFDIRHSSNIIHIPGWAAGIFYAYLTNNRKYTMLGRNIYFIGLIVAFIACLIPPFLLDDFNYFWQGFYASFGTILFIFGIGFFVFGMTQGFGGPIRKLCESKFVQMLGRLSFASFLINLMVIRTRFAYRRTPQLISYFDLTCDVILNTFYTYTLSLIFALFVEIPFGKLLKWESRTGTNKND